MPSTKKNLYLCLMEEEWDDIEATLDTWYKCATLELAQERLHSKELMRAYALTKEYLLDEKVTFASLGRKYGYKPEDISKLVYTTIYKVGKRLRDNKPNKDKKTKEFNRRVQEITEITGD